MTMNNFESIRLDKQTIHVLTSMKKNSSMKPSPLHSNKNSGTIQGAANYCSHFVKNFASRTTPMLRTLSFERKKLKDCD